MREICRRQNFDKRTLRRRNKTSFFGAIQEWRSHYTAPLGRSRRAGGCHVAVRLRPMFEKEQQGGEFPVVTVNEEWGEVVVHNCLFHADLVRMYVHHNGFCFPRAFGAIATNEEVFAECGAPLVAHALRGQLGTLFMFGQTGSGKTYTMNEMMELAARRVFDVLRNTGDDVVVHLKSFEVAGRKCFDLLPKVRTELKLLDDQSGRTNIVGAIEAPVRSAEECCRLLREALARRATAGHQRNDESSRSHCVCVLNLVCGGSLIFVDCAGTERRQDSDQHSAERMRESAEINASLHALKECMRQRAKEKRPSSPSTKAQSPSPRFHRERRSRSKGMVDEEDQRQVHVPYRDSQLTRVLQESFTRQGGYLAAIGTISPTSMDTEHTLSTLKALQMLLGDGSVSDAPSFEARCDVDPKVLLRSSILKAHSRGMQGKVMQPPRSRLQTEGVQPRASQILEMDPSSCKRRSFGRVEGPKEPISTELPESPVARGSDSGDRSQLVLEESGDASLQGVLSSISPYSRGPLAKGIDLIDRPRSPTSPIALYTDESSFLSVSDDLEPEATPEHRASSISRKENVVLRRRVAELEDVLQARGSAPSALEFAALQQRAEAAERRAEEAERKCGHLESLFRAEQELRRWSHNQVLDLKGQIRVFCRIRPLLPHEHGEDLAAVRKDPLTVEVSREMTAVDGAQRVDKRTFSFESVFGPQDQQDEVFQEVEDLVQSAVDGYNVTIMAHGQTGAGKTYTMYGGPHEKRGVAPRTIESVFGLLQRKDDQRFGFSVRAHLIELYKNELVDLLAPSRGRSTLDVRRDARTGETTVENVEERSVSSHQELSRILEEGMERRTTATTMMNADSSRSHFFLTISIDVQDKESKETTSGKITLCDLAGSERPKKSGASGEVMKEAIEINKALTALGDVIEALTRGGARGPIPYRNHKLTQLLSDSLGGTAKTLLFVNVSPARSEAEETINSMAYATRLRSVTNDIKRSQCLKGPSFSPIEGRQRPVKVTEEVRRSSKTMEDLGDDFVRDLRLAFAESLCRGATPDRLSAG